MLGRRNEIIALRAGGISLRRRPPHPGLGSGDQCRQPGLDETVVPYWLAQSSSTSTNVEIRKRVVREYW